MNVLATSKVFDGKQQVIEHSSDTCGVDMRLALYLPPGKGPFPVLVFLSGLTCTEQNFITKSGFQRRAAELNLAVLAPDTSPRGEGVADDADWDFGQGAGFYVDATQDPWRPHYQLASYVSQELWQFINEHRELDAERVGISGHSMGGHGALTLHLKHPKQFRTVSAFAPIVAPSQVPWGRKALGGYLGDDSEQWRQYDACELVQQRPRHAHVLIDQGANDAFLSDQLKPELFERACSASGQSLKLRLQPGYDHSYYFIATFIDDHLSHHAELLGG